ncbi:isochorismatase family protein [Austwickia chelonae]|uniref:isochorismatase family protein n=1 Tax=Austwickia chelonae TaxID=100225 RepID=UPI000E22A3EB|nr:isochorismatase family protein [Austwickia chelonae]
MALPSRIDYTIPTTDIPEPVVSWTLDPERCALLLHDLQPHFLHPFAPAMREQLTANVDAIAATCRAQGIPIAHAMQPDDQTPAERGLLTEFWGPGPLSSNDSGAPDLRLQAREGEIVIIRRRYNAFLGTGLDAWMREQGRDQLIVCGIYAHVGCLMTSAHAFMTDRQPFLVADGTADFSADEHRMALEYVTSRCGVCVTTGDLVAMLSDSQPLSA